MAYESVNPNNGKTVKKFPELTDAQLQSKIAKAAQAYQSWKKTPYANRATIVAKAAKLMHAQVDTFAKHATIERGKLINEARDEVNYSADILAYYARAC
jgi:succinate-semialdehyde dehydrogenase/glutarate-semialdehyde dehydrogenase